MVTCFVVGGPLLLAFMLGVLAERWRAAPRVCEAEAVRGGVAGRAGREAVMVDWKSMTPEEVHDAITSAPRVAGQWWRSEDGHYIRTEALPGDFKGVAAWVGDDDRDSSDGETPPPYATREDADAALRAEGWVLVD
jgi:hypothetical protein